MANRIYTSPAGCFNYMPRGVNMLSSKDILSVMRERPLICTPIPADNSDSYLNSLQSAKNMGSDIAEFRIDYFNNISSEILNNVINETGANVAKMVFTPVTNKDIRSILSVTEKFSNNEMLFTIFGMRQKG